MQRFTGGADMPFKRVPNNSPGLFSLGHKLITMMFHNGAFATLEATVRHHLDPEGSFSAWTRNKVQLPPDPAFAATDFVNWEDQREIARIKAK